MPFNSTSSDLGAVFWKNGVVFTSDRPNSMVRYTLENNKLPTDIFFSERTVKGEWKRAVAFSAEINSKYNEGPLSFTRNGDTLFICRNSERGRLEIFYNVLLNGKWTAPIPLPFNNPAYSVAHPCISPSAQELYFCSDMPGGHGGKDLYVSRFINGGWTAPENLGKKINTSQDEMFPFFSDSVLYFASNGHFGKGGLDIFSAEMRNGHWGEVSNYEVFNSPKDDFSFFLDSSLCRGFLSSNRLKGDDTYFFELLEPAFPLPDTLQKNDYCYTLFEESTASSDTLPYKYVWNLGNGLLVKAKEVYHCFPGPGTYKIHLNIVDTLATELPAQEIEYAIELRDHEQLYIACQDTVKTGLSALFDASDSNLPGFKIKSYFWDFGDGIKGRGVKVEHFYSKPGVYYVTLGSEMLTINNQKTKKSVVKKIIVVNRNELNHEK